MCLMTMPLMGCFLTGNQSNDVVTNLPPFPASKPCVGPAILHANVELIEDKCYQDVRAWLADLGRLKMKLEGNN